MEQNRPSMDKLSISEVALRLKPQKIAVTPRPINISAIIPDRLHLSLNQPAGIEPNPTKRDPKNQRSTN